MPGVQIADLAGGALWGATGILGALLGRDRTGEGAHLDISMTEGALALLAAELGNLDCAPDARPSRGNQALSDAGAAVDQHLGAFSQNELRRPVAFGRDHRAAGAEKDDFHGRKG